MPANEKEQDELIAKRPECVYCKYSVTVSIGGGEFVRVCKKNIGCSDFTPADA